MLEFIQYSTEEMLKIFSDGLSHLPETMPESFSKLFTSEMMKNVFNETRRFELSLKEEDVLLAKRSDRGMSIDEGPEYEDKRIGKDEVTLLHEKEQQEVMRLKKTTVLTGNHTVLNKRNRAQSENEIFTSQFKGSAVGSGIEMVPKTIIAPAEVV